MPEDFRARDDCVNVICVFNVDGDGTYRFARRGELSSYRPTETYLERWDGHQQRWIQIGTIGFLETHPRVRDLMEL